MKQFTQPRKFFLGCIVKFGNYQSYLKQSPNASAAEVPSSRREALAMSSPVRSLIMVW